MSMSLIAKVRESLIAGGIDATFEKTIGFCRAHLRVPSAVEKRRRLVGRRISKITGGVIKYGAFSGLKLPVRSSWSDNDRASIILGMYEKEVLEELTKLFAGRSTFIDIGAADGYYAVGCLAAGMCERCICFEENKKGRDTVAVLAQVNAVSNRLVINGLADSDTLYSLLREGVDPSDCVILIDIEGGELEVLSAEVLETFRAATFLVEIHKCGSVSADEMLHILRGRAADWFEASTIRQGARNPELYPELLNVSETDGWLACSEGRGYRQDWLLLQPRQHIP